MIYCTIIQDKNARRETESTYKVQKDYQVKLEVPVKKNKIEVEVCYKGSKFAGLGVPVQ